MKIFLPITLITVTALAASIRVLAEPQTAPFANEKMGISRQNFPERVRGPRDAAIFGHDDIAALNVRERDQDGQMFHDRSSSSTDTGINRAIRKDIMAQDGMSVDDQNVKIITEYGKVTLLGSVKTDEEKRYIYESALNLVSPDNIDDQLDVIKDSQPS